ncbi:hypothetical protein [Halorussus ruber]|uniref:hypothetical protein n=1 Tax=Halorussus ruber TaxID=1126238 RepID=UPI001091BE92|nr:hypothetical protein [Halorussus ruber]
MATRNFTLYDLLADIIPGAIALVLSFIFYDVPQIDSLSNSTLIAGTAFFVLAYFVGRLIHSVGSIISPCLKWINSRITGVIERDGSLPSFSKNKENPDYCIKELIEESSHRSNIDKNKIPNKVSTKVLEDLDRYFRRRLRAEYENEEAKKYGETLLYREATLYSKYEAIVNFFRSILLLPIVLLVEFAILQCSGTSLNTNLNAFSKWETLAFWLVIFAFLLSLYAGRKFWKARNIAFINDLHIVLTRDNDE